MTASWEILVVDDEPDVLDVTKLALKRRTWSGKPFRITTARSGEEARALLQQPSTPRFSVAIIDVVMETDHAGLELCRFIRGNLPLAMRIILRTGQPGSAPEDVVLNEYDIDTYLSKAELTDERLFAAIRTSLRSSLDVEMLLIASSQGQALADLLQRSTTTVADLAQVVGDGLRALEGRFDVTLAFVPDVAALDGATLAPLSVGLDAALGALHRAHDRQPVRAVLESPEGLGECLVMPIAAFEPREREADRAEGFREKTSRFFRGVLGAPESRRAPARGAFLVRPTNTLSPRQHDELERSLALFSANWRIAFGILSLQEMLVSERLDAIDLARRVGA